MTGKKQVLSGLLVLCLLAGLLPASALAVEEPDMEKNAGFTPGLIRDVWDGWDEDLFELQPPLEEEDGTFFEFVSDADPEEEHLSYPDYESMPMPAADTVPERYNCNIGNLEYQSRVKNQSRNGLCWAFGMYGTVEANMLRNHLAEQDFSEMHLAYATSNSSGENPLEGLRDHAPNSGRTRYTSSAYLMRNTDLSGAVDEAEDPYWPDPLPERPLDETRSKEKSYKVQNIRFLGDGSAAPGWSKQLWP